MLCYVVQVAGNQGGQTASLGGNSYVWPGGDENGTRGQWCSQDEIYHSVRYGTGK